MLSHMPPSRALIFPYRDPSMGVFVVSTGRKTNEVARELILWGYMTSHSGGFRGEAKEEPVPYYFVPGESGDRSGCLLLMGASLN